MTMKHVTWTVTGQSLVDAPNDEEAKFMVTNMLRDNATRRSPSVAIYAAVGESVDGGVVATRYEDLAFTDMKEARVENGAWNLRFDGDFVKEKGRQ